MNNEPNDIFNNNFNIDNEYIEYLTNLVDRYTNNYLNLNSGEAMRGNPDISSDGIFFNFTTTSNISKYNLDDYNLATIYFNHLRDEWSELNKTRLDKLLENENFECYINSPSLKILNILLDSFYKNDEMFPSLEQFLNLIYNDRCICSNRFNNITGARVPDSNSLNQSNYVKNIVIDFVLLYSNYPNCNYFPYYIEFYILHNRIPLDNELEVFLDRIREFFNSPENFHQKDKLLVPTLNTDKLEHLDFGLIKSPVNDCCAICREEFEEKTQVVKLRPCLHLFHYNNNECLQDASIFNWLHSYNFCPLCKSKVTPN